MQEKNVVSSYWALRIALGVVPIVAGLDKFTNLLADWEGYISPLARLARGVETVRVAAAEPARSSAGAHA